MLCCAQVVEALQEHAASQDSHVVVLEDVKGASGVSMSQPHCAGPPEHLHPAMAPGSHFGPHHQGPGCPHHALRMCAGPDWLGRAAALAGQGTPQLHALRSAPTRRQPM